MDRISGEGKIDLEACETALRSAVLAAGAHILSDLLKSIGSGRSQEPIVCQCGTRMESQGVKSKGLLTILGPVDYARSMFQCPTCHTTRYPGDELLDIVNTTRSPGLRRMMARAGSQSPFKEGSQDLRIYAGIDVSPKDVERVAERIGADIEAWSQKERQILLDENRPISLKKTIPVLYISYDGTGVPMTRTEVEGRKGKQADGSAKTREAKLGSVFTQTTTDSDGFPVRDPESTTFVGQIETAEDFGYRIYAEAVRRGLYHAQHVVILGDGAEWIRTIAEMHFPGATQIIDLYHAREHVASLCKILFGSMENEVTHHRIRWWYDMDAGAIENIIQEARLLLPDDLERCKNAETEMNYLHKNKERMRYADFRARGFFVGSGVVEAGCKSVVGQRLKQSGMEWSVRGANAILSLRCAMVSGRLEDYWEDRVA
ncbi:MAG: ISKra4 family transposase [Bacteroidota bacterium]